MTPAHRSDGGPCAFVVLAHRNPDQVLRLIGRLGCAPIFLHVDKGAASTVYRRLVSEAGRYPSVRFLPRVRSAWASWGIVEAMLSGLRAAHSLDISHAAVLTGQDYPLVPVSDIHSFSQCHQGQSFVASWTMPTPLWGPQGGMERIRYWHRPIYRHRFRWPIARSFPAGVRPFGGSANFLVSRTAIGHLLDFIFRRPDVVRFYRHTWIPDEMLIATGLHNSSPSDELIDENLWFADWPPGGGKHPRVLDSSDADVLLAAAGKPGSAAGRARAKLFARKFDTGVDAAILDRLDRQAMQTH
jgi:hypothetical protein